jgi:peroxiredoxin
MQQVVDLQNDPDFQSLDTALLSIAFDSADEQGPAAQELNITVPMLVDSDQSISTEYEVLQWAVGTGEPGHTFILVDKEGKIAWIRDYGAPENGGTMYVPVAELVSEIQNSLNQ